MRLSASELTSLQVSDFWGRVKLGSSGCWDWTGSVNGHSGYGDYCAHGKHTQAHRIAWSLKHGPIPPDAVICHTCDNRRCINPAHLFCGTPYDNVHDCIDKGRMFTDDYTKMRAKVNPIDDLRPLPLTQRGGVGTAFEYWGELHCGL